MTFYEDIADDYHALVGSWVLTAEDIIAFARVWDPQPFHVDAKVARQSPFGGLVASSAHLFAIVTRLFHDHEDRIQVRAMLGKDKLRLPNPGRAGDTLCYHTRCIGKRESARRRQLGIVTLADTVTAGALTVLSQEVTLMVAKRNAA